MAFQLHLWISKYKSHHGRIAHRPNAGASHGNGRRARLKMRRAIRIVHTILRGASPRFGSAGGDSPWSGIRGRHIRRIGTRRNRNR
jgi:hypothetical protein